MGGVGGTDLDTTELHQHNDQSTQSRPKPEGSGRRRVACYKPQKQKAEAGNVACERMASVCIYVGSSKKQPKKQPKNKTASLYFHTSSLSDKNMNNREGAEAQMDKQEETEKKTL